MDHITETNSDDIAIAAAIRTLFNTPPIAAVLRKIIASEIKEVVSSGAVEFDPKEIADHIELSDLADHIELSDLADHISIDSEDLNYRRLAESIIRQLNTPRY